MRYAMATGYTRAGSDSRLGIYDFLLEQGAGEMLHVSTEKLPMRILHKQASKSVLRFTSCAAPPFSGMLVSAGSSRIP